MSMEQTAKGDTTWGGVIIGIIFFPNAVFILWFIHANRKNLWNKNIIFKVVVSAMVQLLTLIRY